jgi:hypothetical protein
VKRIQMISGDEYDVLTPRRRHLGWTQRAGATSRVKRGYRRRERYDVRRALRSLDLETA